MFMFIHILHVCLFVFVHICSMYMSMRTYMHVYVYVYVQEYVYVYVYVNVCVCMCMCMFIYLRMQRAYVCGVYLHLCMRYISAIICAVTNIVQMGASHPSHPFTSPLFGDQFRVCAFNSGGSARRMAWKNSSRNCCPGWRNRLTG